MILKGYYDQEKSSLTNRINSKHKIAKATVKYGLGSIGNLLTNITPEIVYEKSPYQENVKYNTAVGTKLGIIEADYYESRFNSVPTGREAKLIYSPFGNILELILLFKN